MGLRGRGDYDWTMSNDLPRNRICIRPRREEDEFMQGNESYDRASLARGFATLCAALIVAAPAGALAAPTETVLHAFTGGSDGGNPQAGLIAVSNG